MSDSDGWEADEGPFGADPGGSVRRAVAQAVRDLPGGLAGHPLAASALRLASVMDGARSSRDIAAVARELRETLDRLRELAPPEEKKDSLDELRARRASRRGA